ncbi:MAG: diaminopimelate epimerase [Thermodesulfovibrionales bacterium]|nr:diaminopimelate epimerase [Thermodesulfovibrionales bacterium]
MKINFSKMHGLGNDFVLIDARALKAIDLREFAAFLLNRRFGIGADQLLILEDSVKADFRMRIFNPDGSEVEMCGNGIRCLASYIWKKGLSDKSPLEIETPAGIIRPERINDLVRVDMGMPRLIPEEIPVNIAERKPLIDYPLKIKDRIFHITCVSMGNPHAVIPVNDLDTLDLHTYGPLIENHPLFPKRINVEFVRKDSPDTFRVRVWERGAGETLACGTGASAVAVAMRLKGLGGLKQNIILPGGELIIELLVEDEEIKRVFMTGPAQEVFTGEIEI